MFTCERKFRTMTDCEAAHWTVLQQWSLAAIGCKHAVLQVETDGAGAELTEAMRPARFSLLTAPVRVCPDPSASGQPHSVPRCPAFACSAGEKKRGDRSQSVQAAMCHRITESLPPPYLSRFQRTERSGNDLLSKIRSLRPTCTQTGAVPRLQKARSPLTRPVGQNPHQ